MLTGMMKSLFFLVLISKYVVFCSNLRSLNNSGFKLQPSIRLAFVSSNYGPQSTHTLSYKLYAKPGQRRETYNKRDLVSQVAEKLNKTQKEVGQVVDEFLSSLKHHLSNNDVVTLSKFGVFKNSLRGERRMRNLQTGEIFTAKPVHVPSLRFYDTFKADVNNNLKMKDKRGGYSYNY